MSAPMHTARPTASTGKRLPWWSVTLPIAAFAVLLVLMTGSGQAHAVGVASEAPGIAYLLERVLDALSL
ncbi:hypothetical protein [Streptomyces sp. NPDC054863]